MAGGKVEMEVQKAVAATKRPAIGSTTKRLAAVTAASELRTQPPPAAQPKPTKPAKAPEPVTGFVDFVARVNYPAPDLGPSRELHGLWFAGLLLADLLDHADADALADLEAWAEQRRAVEAAGATPDQRDDLHMVFKLIGRDRDAQHVTASLYALLVGHRNYSLHMRALEAFNNED